jgi:hypothetical protein
MVNDQKITQQTLDYLKDRYNEEQARFDHFENKCSRFLTFVTIIIAAITTISGLKNGAIFHPQSFFETLIFLLFIIGAIAIISSWGQALSALKIGECATMPNNKDAAQYLKDVDGDDASSYIFKCYVDTIDALSKDIKTKADKLKIAYSDLILSAWCLSIVATVTIILEVQK